MGTYDTRGGSPISPNEPDYSTTQREEAVLGVLEVLDVARTRVRAVLCPILLEIVSARFPIGGEIDLRSKLVLHGHAHGATRAKVVRILPPDVSLEHPEFTRVQVECVCLKKDGSESANLVRITESVLGPGYNPGVAFDRKSKAPRDYLVELVRALEMVDESIAMSPR